MVEIKPRAIMVCVDYADYLAVTLPYNQHHFSDIRVITTPDDRDTIDVCRSLKGWIDMSLTRSFYADGAEFNKWKAIEEGLDTIGRHGWLCIMDADVLWPRDAKLENLEIGKLYSPLRYMHNQFDGHIPPEADWPNYPIHRNTAEWAGFTQVFHADDSQLGQPPWHETNWKHAGGADSFFQRKWSGPNKVRLPWNVLHLGEAGRNWCGRVTPTLDGETPAEAQQRRQSLSNYMRQRRTNRDFRAEKID